jgi:hypothetical protein
MYFSDGYRIISGPICLVHTEDVRQYNYVARLGYITSGHIGSTSTTSCALTTCLTAASALHQQRRTPQLLVSRPHHLYITFAVHRVYSSPGRTGSTSTSPCAASTCLPAAAALPQLRRASGCLGLSRGSSSTTRLRRASGCLSTSRGSSSTTSLTPRVRVPRHVGRLVARLLVDYSTYTARPGASARRAARRRLLRLRRASGCLGTSRGSSSTTSPTSRVRVLRHVARLIVNYFAYIARPGALACRAARLVYYFAYTARPGASHVARLVVDYFSYTARPGASARHAARRAALRRLLRLHRASWCLGSSSTTSPTPRIRVPRHVARLVAWLVSTPRVRVPRHVVRLIDYFASRKLIVSHFADDVRSGASAPLTATSRRLAARLHVDRLHWLLSCARSLRLTSQLLVARMHWLYCAYAMHLDAPCRRSSSHRSVALAPAMRSVTLSRDSTTPCPAATTSSCGHSGSTSATLCVATTCLAATPALLRVRRAPLQHRLLVASRRPLISTSFPN